MTKFHQRRLKAKLKIDKLRDTAIATFNMYKNRKREHRLAKLEFFRAKQARQLRNKTRIVNYFIE